MSLYIYLYVALAQDALAQDALAQVAMPLRRFFLGGKDDMCADFPMRRRCPCAHLFFLVNPYVGSVGYMFPDSLHEHHNVSFLLFRRQWLQQQCFRRIVAPLRWLSLRDEFPMRRLPLRRSVPQNHESKQISPCCPCAGFSLRE